MKNYLHKITKIQLILAGFVLVAVAIILIVLQGNKRFDTLTTQISDLNRDISSLQTKLASTSEELNGSIVKTRDTLSDRLNQERQNAATIAQNLKNEVGNVSSTVTTLQKLSKTDPELLAKYSKVFFLNENYAPSRLVEIPNTYKYSDAKILKINDQVWPFLKKMMDDAGNNGIAMYVQSGYRSFNEQQALKGNYTVTYGAGTANSFAADQGYSEHQLGTTIDMITTGLGGELDGFETTKPYSWLINNAYKYGFIISYPKDNKFYIFEPWHWRFVGIKLATDLHNQGKNFYDLDQRKIDEYLVNLFDQ